MEQGINIRIEMKLVHTISDLQAELSALKAQNKKVGLVPTMGGFGMPGMLRWLNVV